MTKFRRNIFLIGLATMGIGALPTLALANADCGPKGGSHEKFIEQMEKHQSQLHDKLKLNSEQNIAWKKFSDTTKLMESQNRPDKSELSALHAPERMEKMLALMKEHESRMAERVVAVKEFYAVLSPEQQKIFDDQFSNHRRH